MDSIQIDLGIKRLQINDGPEFIQFSPDDITFAEHFYQLIQDFQTKQVEYQKRAEAIDANTALDANGIPANVPEGLAMMHEVCDFMRERIDLLFGEGTSQKVFGDALSLGMYESFFQQITPYIQRSRSEKIAQYAPPPVAKKRRHKAVMK
jgi:hypothetical protein